MKNKIWRSSLYTFHIFISLLFISLILACNSRFADGKIHISDDLDDVIDNEEDDDWKQWGNKFIPQTEFDPPPDDFSNMKPSEIHKEMLKRNTGPSFGFVKLRFGIRRTPDAVAQIAIKWSKILRSGSLEAKFMAFDLSTVMFTMGKGQDTMELKEFILNQAEAYEIKIGDQIFRRPGDPPLEDAIEKLQSERNTAIKTPAEDLKNLPDEL